MVMDGLMSALSRHRLRDPGGQAAPKGEPPPPEAEPHVKSCKVK